MEKIQSPSHVSRGSTNRSRASNAQTEVGHEDQPRINHPKARSSTNPSPTPTLNAQLASSLKAVYRQRNRLIEKRGNIAILRTQHEHQRRDVIASAHRISESIEALIAHLHGTPSSDTLLKEAQESLLESKQLHGRFEETELKLQQVARQLNVKEQKLSKNEKRVYKTLSQITGITSDNLTPGSSQSDSSVSTARTNPHARQYYNRAGQVRDLRDTIHNFQVQFEREIAMRRNQRELGIPASTPDSMFQERFDSELASLRDELEGARKDAALYKLACQRQGVTLIDDSEPEDDSEIIDLSLEFDTSRDRPAKQRSNRERTLSVGNSESGYKDPTLKINLWLKAVPLGEQAILGTQPIVDYVAPYDAEVVGTVISPTEVAAPVENRLTAGFLANEERRTSSWRLRPEANEEAISDGSDGPTSPFDYEFSSAQYDDNVTLRRYSDQNTTPSFALWPVSSSGIVSSSSRKQRRRRFGRYSH